MMLGELIGRDHAKPVAEVREIPPEVGAIAAGITQHFVVFYSRGLFSNPIVLEPVEATPPFCSVRPVEAVDQEQNPFDNDFPLVARGRVNVVARRGILPEAGWDY
jgi:hypothetical protein